jgi:hypothetical protein
MISLLVLFVVIVGVVVGVALSRSRMNATLPGSPAQPASAKASRLAAVRRFYIYLVAFVSLVTGLFGVQGLLDLLSQYWLHQPAADFVASIGYERTMFAQNMGLLLVATPIFLIHWGLAQHFRSDPDERASVLRKLFLYGATAVGLAFLLTNAYFIIEGLARLAFGTPPALLGLWTSQWLAWVAMIAGSGALVLYWEHIIVGDGDYAYEPGAGFVVRQFFLVFAGLTGLVILMWGSRQAVETGLQLVLNYFFDLLPGDWWRLTLSVAIAQMLVGSWLARANWLQWNAVLRLNPSEGPAALRRFYLYAGIVLGAVATLTPTALLLREGLLMLFGESTGSLPDLLLKLIGPLSLIPVGLVVWIWHARVLRREAVAFGESTEAATVRRLYYYLMTATGLALMWVGAVQLLNGLIDYALVGEVWSERLATGISLLVVGAPVWLFHWRRVQGQAERTDFVGAGERTSWPRKLYLYGVALVGALIILFTLAQAIYRLLLAIMGDPDAGFLSAETAHLVAESLVAILFWVLHILAIRSDTQLDRAYAATAPAPVVDVATRRKQLQQRVAVLEGELAAAQAELAQLGETT